MQPVRGIVLEGNGVWEMMNALTFDVEDWFQVDALSDVIRYEDWEKCESRILVNMVRILEQLERRKMKATFFMLGWIAERYPEVVRMVSEAGHEVATHGYSHRSVGSLSRAEFEEDLERSLRVLEAIVPGKVLGYRAPNFSVSHDTFWVFEVLADHGIEYDSSVFPIKHDRYGVADFPRFPVSVRLNDSKKIVEFPVSTVSLLGKNIPVSGGGYFRLYPYHFIKWAIRSINRKGRPVLVFLHPWELDPDLPRVGRGLLSRFRTYANLYLTQDRFVHLLNDFDFCSVRDLLAENDSLPEVFALHIQHDKDE